MYRIFLRKTIPILSVVSTLINEKHIPQLFPNLAFFVFKYFSYRQVLFSVSTDLIFKKFPYRKSYVKECNK